MSYKREYTEAEVVRLQELQSVAKKHWQLASSYYDQANGYYEQTKKTLERLDASYMKLELACSELTKQMQVVDQLVGQFRLRNNSLNQLLETTKNTEEEINRRLKEVFQQLKSQQVDPNLRKDANLHDYVDADSVYNLQSEVATHIREMKSLQLLSHTILIQLESSYDKMLKLWKESSLTVEYKTPFGLEKTSIQVNELKAISSFLMSVSSTHDLINHIYNNRHTMVMDLSSLETRTHTELPSQITKILDSLKKIQLISGDVEARVAKMNSIFNNGSLLLNSLESFGIEIKARLKELEEIEAGKN